VGVASYIATRQIAALTYSAVQKAEVKRVFEGKRFRKIVDLGCGIGLNGTTLKSHCDTLIGVDIFKKDLQQAGWTGFYDELVVSDVRSYSMPRDADAIVLFDVLEHLDENDGLMLLEALQATGAYVLIDTPTQYRRDAFPYIHLSYWSPTKLQEMGFRVWIINALFGKLTFAEYGGVN